MSGQAANAAPSGTAVAVVQSASIDGETGKQVLQAEAPVFTGDRIETGNVGEAQIIFRDKTKLVVGPNSSMVIDAFIFDDNNTAREISINAVKGAFRFITGTSRKDAYSIITPTATIGVRGTEFDISVESEGTTRVANFEGMTRICRRGGAAADCIDVKDPCSVSVVRPTEPKVVRLSNQDVEFRNRQLKYYFNYVRDQSSLLKDFQVDLAQCKFTTALQEGNQPTPPSLPPAPGVAPPVPMPGGVGDPPFVAPPAPPVEDRHPTLPTYDHGPEVRP